ELADRFASTIDHGGDLRQLGAIQLAIAEQYGQTGVEERADHFFERAEYNIEQSLIVEDHALGHVLLAELRIGEGDYDEAEAELEKARPLVSDRDEEAQIEYALGNIALQREQFDTARQYFERVAEIKPDYQGIWFYIGYTYRMQKNYAEAETYYKRAIGAEPHDIRPYSELSSAYMNTDRWSEAFDILMQGISANPGSAHLRAL